MVLSSYYISRSLDTHSSDAEEIFDARKKAEDSLKTPSRRRETRHSTYARLRTNHELSWPKFAFESLFARFEGQNNLNRIHVIWFLSFF